MTISVSWSLTNGGAALTSALDHGSLGNGDIGTATEIFVRHDGANPITSAGLYVREFSGTYSGTFSAASDLAELLAWGDAATANGFGGLQVNFDATGSYAADWPTYDNKAPGSSYVFKTGQGDSEANAITLPTSTGCPSAGTIPAGASPNVRLKLRVVCPSDEDTVGIRQIDQVLRFSFTS